MVTCDIVLQGNGPSPGPHWPWVWHHSLRAWRCREWGRGGGWNWGWGWNRGWGWPRISGHGVGEWRLAVFCGRVLKKGCWDFPQPTSMPPRAVVEQECGGAEKASDLSGLGPERGHLVVSVWQSGPDPVGDLKGRAVASPCASCQPFLLSPAAVRQQSPGLGSGRVW